MPLLRHLSAISFLKLIILSIPIQTFSVLAQDGRDHQSFLDAGHYYTVPADEREIDITTGTQFNGLMTFANLPYVNCFVDEEAAKMKYDIALLGAPFDTSVTARPGARYGPSGIRRGSQRMSASEWSIYTGENVLASWATIVDCGNAPLTYLDNRLAIAQLDASHKLISSRPTPIHNSSTSDSASTSASKATANATAPRILTLGGDHTTTLSALRSTFRHWGPVSVIHFDSHIDTWDPTVLGGGPGGSNAGGLNHGTFLHVAHEEGLILNTSIHAGIRAPVIRARGDVRNDLRCGFTMIKARDIDRFGTGGVIERIKERVGGSRVYVSVDIDVLDPAFAPGTGTAEVGGWSSRELLTLLDGLGGLRVVGADVVEVAPVYDNVGETTVLAAAEVALSLIGLMVQTPIED